MASEQVVIFSPSLMPLVMADQNWVGQQVASAQAQDNVYADNSAGIALAAAKDFASKVVADALVALLPVLPEPTPPIIGYGALTVEDVDGNIMVFRDQKYVDSVGSNASALAVTQSNAFTLIKVSDAIKSINDSMSQSLSNTLQSANGYTDQTKATLIDVITTSRIASENYTDNSIAALKANQSWISIKADQVTDLEETTDTFGYVKVTYVDTQDQSILSQAKNFTTTSLSTLESDQSWISITSSQITDIPSMIQNYNLATIEYVNIRDAQVLTQAEAFTTSSLIPYASTLYVNQKDSDTLAAANTHSDSSISALKSNQNWISITSSQVNDLVSEIESFGFATTASVDSKDQAILHQAEAYTDEQISQLEIQGITLQGFVHMLQQIKKANVVWRV